MRLNSLRHFTPVHLVAISILLLLSFARSASADPAGDYQGWIWEEGVFTDFGFTEEFCLGQINLNIAVDLTWSTDNTGTIDVCWGRTTTNTGRFHDNVPWSSASPQDVQSTRPLVDAGGNLLELYGEDLIGDIGQGEERLATILSSSGANFLIMGGYDALTQPAFIDEFRFIDLFVTSTPSVRDSRITTDLEGTSWHGARFFHRIDTFDAGAEAVISTVSSFDLQAGGVCSYSISSVFPEFTGDADLFTAFQTDDGINFDNRFVSGGLVPQGNSTCSYSIDADKYLVITRVIATVPEVRRFVISDDNRYLIPAPAIDIDNSPQSLYVGYRAGSGAMTTDAIDGTFLFYLSVNEFGADGSGAAAAGFGPRDWQEFEGLGRGKLEFDSTSMGTTPEGETGVWNSCDIEMVFNDFEHELTGSVLDSSVDLGFESGPSAEYVLFNDCDYQLDADGGLSLYLRLNDPIPADGFKGILRGYVNDNGELMSLLYNEVGPGVGADRDTAEVIFALGMKYTGDPAANVDSDEFTNLEEFQLPLPPPLPPVVKVIPLPDVTSDAIEDVAVLRPDSTLAEVRSGTDGQLQRTIAFFADFAATAIDAVALPDADGNGVAELAVLATRDSDGRIVAEIRNLAGDQAPRFVWFAKDHTALTLKVVDDDADNNGVVELAVLSTRDSDGRILVEVKNAFGTTNTNSVWFMKDNTPLDLEVVPDKDANGVPEVAVLSYRNSDGRIVTEVKNAAGPTAPIAVWFMKGNSAIDLVAIDDKDLNGIPEVAVLSSRNSDGRNVVEIKNVAEITAPTTVWFMAGNTATDVAQIHDADNNGVNEVAVVSVRDSDGRIVVEVKNVTGTTNPNTMWYSSDFSSHGFATIADTDTNGLEEALVLMIRDSDGRILVQGRNTAGNPAPIQYWFSP